MDISPDRTIMPGLMRGVEVQRTRTIKAGKLLYCASYPIWDTSTRRDAQAKLTKAREKKGTTEAQKDLNDRHAAESLERLINANFGAGDLLPSLTYKSSGQPKSIAEGQRNVRNFLARLRRLCRKKGVPDPKYVYVTEIVNKKHGKEYHHHMVLKVQIPRDEVEHLWRSKHGHGDIKIAWNEENNLTQWANYIAKQIRAKDRDEEHNLHHKWAASKGLKNPTATEADKKLSRRRVERIAMEMQRDKEKAMQHMEKCYPGYKVLEMTVKTSEWVTGAYVYTVMCRRE